MQATLDALEKYTRTLRSLAGDREADTRVDAAAQDLSDSIQDLKLRGGDATAAKILATTADALGRQLTTAQRKNALRNTMSTAQPGLELLAAGSHRTLGTLPSYLGVLRDSLLRHANFNRPPYGSWERYQFDLAIADRLREFEQIEAALQASDKAIQGFPDTNANCCRAWTRPNPNCKRCATSPPKPGGYAIFIAICPPNKGGSTWTATESPNLPAAWHPASTTWQSPARARIAEPCWRSKMNWPTRPWR
ncbi:hypothetical protein JOS77_21145 [Chromobacterium haemolyticum]|nr:hypothetical protein JOS77_21145 [Chromobacterium haemolyticum]